LNKPTPTIGPDASVRSKVFEILGFSGSALASESWSDRAKAACGSDEIMISAYCTGDNAALRMDGMKALCAKTPTQWRS
jgi:hypothetical protein